jgi:hypothetical protein
MSTDILVRLSCANSRRSQNVCVPRSYAPFIHNRTDNIAINTVNQITPDGATFGISERIMFLQKLSCMLFGPFGDVWIYSRYLVLTQEKKIEGPLLSAAL